jgi:hypothetical protein
MTAFFSGAQQLLFRTPSIPLSALSFMPNPGIKGYLLLSGLRKKFSIFKPIFLKLIQPKSTIFAGINFRY